VIGGIGARSTKDGIEATSSPWNGTNVPIEIQESRNPVLIERLELIADSAGPGKYRGGCGLRKDLRILAAGTTFYNLSDRHVTRRTHSAAASRAGSASPVSTPTRARRASSTRKAPTGWPRAIC
jgi:N-methylhydantoinase B